MLGIMEQQLMPPTQMQTSNNGLDHSKCLNCQKFPPNPPEASIGQSRGILCRNCQSGVVRALMAHESAESRERRIAAQQREQAEREARKLKEGIDADLYL
jgi:hypothetical protein